MEKKTRTESEAHADMDRAITGFFGNGDPGDWDDVAGFYQYFNELDFGFSFDWFANVQDHLEGGVEAVYYSDALKRTIVLNHNVPDSYKDRGQLIMFLVNVWRDMTLLEAELNQRI